ncbi:MAG: glycosyltransferase family 39 protein [Candidatus Omnitrophota bacterium]|jgi:hypothetical protein
MHHQNINKKIFCSHYIQIVIIGLLALLLRIINLTKYDLWFDEVTSLVEVKLNNFWYLSTNFTFQPLYNLLVQYWQVFGDSLFILRLPSVIFGVASVILIYFTGESVFNRKAGIISAFLLSLSPFSIHYSQELRPFSLLIFLVLLSTYAYFKLLNKRSFPFWSINIIANLLSVYLVCTSAPILLVQALFMIFNLRKNRLREVLLFQSVQFFFLLPWIYITIKHFLLMLDITRVYCQFSPFISSISAANLFYSFKNFISGYYASDIVRNISSVFFALLILKGTKDSFAHYKKKWYMLLSFLLIPVLTLFIFSKFRPFYAERYFSFAIIFLFLMAGFTLSNLGRKMIMLCLGVYCFISIPSLNNYYSNRITCNFIERQGTNPKKELKKAAYFLKANYKNGDLVLHTSEVSTLPLEYYLNERGSNYFLKEDAMLTYKFIMDSQVKNRVNRFLIIHEPNQHRFYFYKDIGVFTAQPDDPLFNNHERIWLILSHWEDPAQFKFINNWFADKHILEKSAKFSGIDVYLYANNRVLNHS